MPTQEDETRPEQLPMVPDRIRQAAISELDRLRGLIHNVPTSGWSRPSAATGWSIGDVAAHLSLVMRMQSQMLDAAGNRTGTGGMWKSLGDLTRSAAPVMAPALNAINKEIPKLLDRSMSREAVLSQFDRAGASLRERLDRLIPADYSKQVYYIGGPWPLSFFLGHIVNELAIHGWDIAAALDPQARISEDARTVLPWFYWSGTPFMLRPPAGLQGTIQVLLADPALEMWWRVSAGKKEQGMGLEANPAVTINAESGTFVLALAGRIKPLDALRFAAIEVRGSEELARSFLAGWHIV